VTARGMADAPYIRVRMRGGKAAVDGAYHWRRVPSRIDAPDPLGEAWAKWSWDGETLTFASDRYGMIPVFYTVSDDGVTLSPSLTKLIELGASRELNFAALSVFLRLGWFLENDTPFIAIKTMPPGARFSWRAGAHALSGGAFVASGSSIGFDAAADRLHELFTTAIARRRPPDHARFVMPISGGKDSRLILFEFLRQGYRPGMCVSTSTEPPRINDDVKIGEALCDALGLPWRRLELTGSPLARELEKDARSHYLADEHGWYMPLMAYLGDYADYAYDGIGLDVFLNCMLWSDDRNRLVRAGNAQAIADNLLRPDEAAWKSALRPQAYNKLSYEVAYDYLTAAIKPHLAAANPLASFQFWSRTRREIALVPYAMLSDRVAVMTPFLDKEVFDFASSLPVEVLYGRDLRRTVLERYYGDCPQPGYAGETKKARNFRPWFNRRYAAELVLASLKASLPLLRRGWLTTRALKAALTGRQRDLDWCNPARIAWMMALVRLIRH